MGKKPRKLSAYNKFVQKHRLAGKSMKQIGRMWKPKKGKSTSTAKSKPKSGGSSQSSSSTGGRRLGKNSFNMNKIYGLIRKGAIFLPAINIAMKPWSNDEKIRVGMRDYFGYDSQTGTFTWAHLWKGWGPAVGAQVITRVIPAIGKLIRSIF